MSIVPQALSIIIITIFSFEIGFIIGLELTN